MYMYERVVVVVVVGVGNATVSRWLKSFMALSTTGVALLPPSEASRSSSRSAM